MSTDRQIGMGVGEVPASSVHSLADRLGLDDAETEAFRSCVRAMDVAYLKWIATPEAERQKVESRPVTGELFDALFG